MKFSNFGRKAAALVSTLALGAGLSSCGSGTIGYLYVLGQLTNSGSFGQISGFKIDDRTGNLTNMVNSPYTSGGTNPGNAVVFPGGRFLFVLNKGIATTATSGHCPANTGGGTISEFLIGGDGVLTFQQNYTSQGINPVWISADSSGRYLYVLDQAASYAAARRRNEVRHRRYQPTEAYPMAISPYFLSQPIPAVSRPFRTNRPRTAPAHHSTSSPWAPSPPCCA